MKAPKALEAAAQQALDAQEMLEWHDLQNAQIDSLKHVWDNPEDDIWNDAPTASAPPCNVSC